MRLLGAVIAAATLLVATGTASAALQRQAGWNARAWGVTPADEDGVRYVGGDFTSFQAWDTGLGVAVDSITGQVDDDFPRVSGWPYAETAVPDGSGGWYVSGGISSVGGTGVNRVAHIEADGTVDTDWRPAVTGGQGVWAMAKVGDVILIGGDFTKVDDVNRTRLAAISTDGTLLDWAPTANSTVHSITVDGDTAYIGGQFSQLAGQSRGLAGRVRLGARTGGATGTCLTAWDATDCVDAWDPAVSGWGVKQIATDGTTVWLGGAISSIDGQTRTGAGSVDATTGDVTTWNPQLDSEAEALAVSGGVVYVGGLFSTAGGQTRRHAAAFDTTTGDLTSWDPDVTGNTVKGIAVQGSTIYLVGQFSQVGSAFRNHAASVDMSGEPTTWDPHICDQSNGSSPYVYGVATTVTQVYMLGDFTCAGGLKRLHAAAVAPDGTLTDWAPALDGPVYELSRNSTGNVYMAGNFLHVNGEYRQRAAAVDTEGTLSAWDPSPGGDRPVAVVATDERVYLAGFFGTMGGVSRPGLAAVDPTTGALESGWDAGVGGPVRSIAVANGRVYLGGDFSTVGGESRPYLAAVSAATGALDTGFAPPAPNHIVEAVGASGSRLYAGGYFTAAGATSRSKVAAFHAETGAIDPDWHPSVTATAIYSMVPTAQAVYFGGQDMSVEEDGVWRTGVAAVDPEDGSLTPWSADTGEVQGISVSNGIVNLAGSFSSVAGQTRPNTAAVSESGVLLPAWPGAEATTAPVTVVRSGDSQGTVTSTPAGIACGATCTHDFTIGSTVTLEAADPEDASFTGWGGACTGSDTTCSVLVTGPLVVNAGWEVTAQEPEPEPEPGPGPTPEPPVLAPELPPAPPATEPVIGSPGEAVEGPRFIRRLTVVAPPKKTTTKPNPKAPVKVTEKLALDEPGRYTIYFLNAKGERIALSGTTRIAGKLVGRKSTAVVVQIKKAGLLNVAAVMPKGSQVVMLRAILRLPDGTLQSQDLPLR